MQALEVAEDSRIFACILRTRNKTDPDGLFGYQVNS